MKAFILTLVSLFASAVLATNAATQIPAAPTVSISDAALGGGNPEHGQADIDITLGSEADEVKVHFELLRNGVGVGAAPRTGAGAIDPYTFTSDFSDTFLMQFRDGSGTKVGAQSGDIIRVVAVFFKDGQVLQTVTRDDTITP